MTNQEKIIAIIAANWLKNLCHNNHCERCVFCDCKGDCSLDNGYEPNAWDIPATIPTDLMVDFLGLSTDGIYVKKNDENKSTDSHPIINPEDVKSKYCRFAEFDQDGCWCNLLHRMVNCCGNEETCMKGYIS